MKICIIGGSNIDYIGTCDHKIILKNSNMGKFRISFGGVGRNIVENLALLGIKTDFITAIGNDTMGLAMKKELEDYGVNVITPESNSNSSSYMALIDNSGDMLAAICDADITSLINSDFLKKYGKILDNSDYIVMDGNLSDEAIEYIFTNYKDKKIIVEATSNDKAVKFQKYLEFIHILKCNKLEYQCLNFDVLPDYTIVTNGGDGITILGTNYIETVDTEKTIEVVNTTGAGDSLLAGLLYGLDKGLDLISSIKIGVEVSKVTLQSIESVNKDLKNYKF